jgi:DNA topoisomerase-3
LSGNQGLFVHPKNGHHDDKAHPPIHPTNYSAQFESREQQQVYELVVRHFLACCSGDAIADETIVTVDMGGEAFTNSGDFFWFYFSDF